MVCVAASAPPCKRREASKIHLCADSSRHHPFQRPPASTCARLQETKSMHSLGHSQEALEWSQVGAKLAACVCMWGAEGAGTSLCMYV